MLASKDVRVGYVLLVSYLILSTVSTVCYQFMAREVPDFEANAIRFAFGLVITGLMVLIRKDSISIPIQQRSSVLLVAFTKLTLILLYFGAVSILPFTYASAMTLGFQGLWSALISKWFIPKFLQVTNVTNVTSHGESPSVEFDVTYIVAIGYTLVFLASGFEALSMVIISAKLKDVKSSTLVFVISCLAIPMSILLSLYMEEPILIKNLSTLGLLVVHAVTIGFAIVIQFTACQILDSTELSIFSNLETLLLLIPQYTMTGSGLYGRLNVSEGLGCVLIVISVSMSILTFRNGSHEDF